MSATVANEPLVVGDRRTRYPVAPGTAPHSTTISPDPPPGCALTRSTEPGGADVSVEEVVGVDVVAVVVAVTDELVDGGVVVVDATVIDVVDDVVAEDETSS